MNECSISSSVKFPDYIDKKQLMECNLNPVVVLKDFKKTLDTSSISQCNHSPKKLKIRSSSSDEESKIKVKKCKVENKTNINVAKGNILNSTQLNPLKRKRKSWDPSVEYEIEKIVGYHRDKRKKMWYFVKWKDWSSDYNTFESIDNLTGCHYELMKYFEVSPPKKKTIRMMDLEIRKGLMKRSIYTRLINREWKAKDVADFSHEFEFAANIFEMQLSKLYNLKRSIHEEYTYILRCLIAMFAHKDPGLVKRGQNYKFLLILIRIRLKQLRKMALVEEFINNSSKTEITIENKEDLEDFPNINYIVEMKPGEGVDLPKNQLLGCECPGGCTPKSFCCGRIGDSTFAYTTNGKLRTSERIAIYECNSRCNCPPTCPNRVVQRGGQVKLCIFKTKSCGWGVKAKEKISKGTFVCEYVGELIPDSEATVRDVKYNSSHRSGYLFDLDFFTDPKLDMFCIDATDHGNIGRFINHSCNPNLVVYPVWIDGIEPNKHRLAFFARRNIQKNEEIRFDYENLEEEEESEEENENNKKGHGLRMISDVRCQCNAANCRNWVFGNK